jgi:hypothetical protein
MTTNFEQVDEFCVIVEDYDKDNIARHEWIISADLSEYHSCEAGWDYLTHDEDKDGNFTGTVQNMCQKCGQTFESKYSESTCNPEIINRKDFESGDW